MHSATNSIMVDVKDLQTMTGLSKNKAMQLGKDANAIVRLGIRRTLYNVQKVQAYINANSGTDNGYEDPEKLNTKEKAGGDDK